MKGLFLYVLVGWVCTMTAFGQDRAYDIEYRKGLLLDVYQPAAMVGTPDKKRPIVIFVHGGGFVEGDKRSGLYVTMATAFAKRGYVCFSVNYTLKPKNEAYSRAYLERCILEVIAAKRWICENGGFYNIDTTAVLLCGDSAGGGLVVNTSYDTAYAAGFIGCIDLWGGLPGGKGWESPIFGGRPGGVTPPTCIIHGTSDRIIPFTTSRVLDEQLASAGVYHELHPLEGADHYPVDRADTFIPMMIDFADGVVAKAGEVSGGRDILQYVNPFIGSDNSGNTNPGVVLPWGMVSISPFNTYDPVRHTAEPSPYYHDRKTMSGFTHLHMSGVGCADMGIVCLTPTTGAVDLQDPYAVSEYSEEQASPGYYSVMLDRWHIRTELSAGLRSSIACFHFPAGRGNILLSLGIGMTTKKGGRMRWVSDTEAEGSKLIGDICGLKTEQTVYFFTRINRRPVERRLSADGLCSIFSFDTGEGEKIYAATGISYVSVENARENLNADQKGFDLAGVRRAAREAWSKELSVVKVSGGKTDDKTKFYTALYHTLLHPNIFEDANGQYRLFEREGVGRVESGHRYTVFSLWDTYRSLHPLLCLLFPGKQSGMVRSLVGMAGESGWLPRWEYAGVESGAMNGDPSLSVIADTWLRGIRDFKIGEAYEAMKRNALTPEKDNYLRPGMTDWLRLGYIPQDAPKILHPFSKKTDPEDYRDMRGRRVVWGPVSTSLEYCIADGSMAALAKALGKKQDYALFYKRSHLYVHSFDPASGFMRPRLTNGDWETPFDPASRTDDGFIEGSSWNYSFMTPHDIPGLMALMGGKGRFVQKLDSCFDLGYFDITNEPDIAYPFLYDHVAGYEWKTQDRVARIIRDDFKNSAGGLPGNDDCGALSAWLVFSMMGLYPDCPADMHYQLCGPVFDTVTIRLDGDYYKGKTFVITAVDRERGRRVGSFRLNGRPLAGFNIRHEDIVGGGKLECLYMGSR